MEKLVDTFYSFIVDTSEIRNSLKPISSDFSKTFENCFRQEDDFNIKPNKQLEIESVLDYLHDELNTGHWSKVPIQIRRAFTAASFVKMIILLKSSNELNNNLLRICLKTLDMGLLLGAPLEINKDILTNSATMISKGLANFDVYLKKSNVKTLKRKHESGFVEDFHNLKGFFVDELSCPSLETFNKYFTSKMPVKLQGCVSHWPALIKWKDLNYLLKTAGDRTVPVEIGSHYADENWGQKLMTLKDFIENHFLENSDIGYLAQHNLFNQIPELRNDIFIPEYCCLSNVEESEDPDINAWFGPAGTVSPLHHDPKNNILVQIFGTKQLVLYSPKDNKNLYPHEGTLLSNTAQVDPFKPNIARFPNFKMATAYKCVLEAGEMLYIPPKWWHHVTAIDKSFSVSFWWN